MFVGSPTIELAAVRALRCTEAPCFADAREVEADAPDEEHECGKGDGVVCYAEGEEAGVCVRAGCDEYERLHWR